MLKSLLCAACRNLHSLVSSSRGSGSCEENLWNTHWQHRPPPSLPSSILCWQFIVVWWGEGVPVLISVTQELIKSIEVWRDDDQPLRGWAIRPIQLDRADEHNTTRQWGCGHHHIPIKTQFGQICLVLVVNEHPMWCQITLSSHEYLALWWSM